MTTRNQKTIPTNQNSQGCHQDVRPQDTPSSDASHMIGTLFEQGPDDHFLETRLIAPGGRVTQLFHQIEALRTGEWVIPGLARLDGLVNVYYSVVPRTCRGGKATDCGPAVAAWTDWDKGHPASLVKPPSILIESSPGKFQGLWLLDIPCGDLRRIEALNQSIVAATNGDPNACDRARVGSDGNSGHQTFQAASNPA